MRYIFVGGIEIDNHALSIRQLEVVLQRAAVRGFSRTRRSQHHLSVAHLTFFFLPSRASELWGYPILHTDVDPQIKDFIRTIVVLCPMIPLNPR